MLIYPPNKANAQENTKIFPGLRPRPRACSAGAGASPQTPTLPPPGRYAPADSLWSGCIIHRFRVEKR